MSFWKQSKGNTSDEFLVKDGPPVVTGAFRKTHFSDLVSTRNRRVFDDYKLYLKRWNILRMKILECFFKDLTVSRARVRYYSDRAVDTDLNTLKGAELFNLFNKNLFGSLHRPYGPHLNRRVSIGQDIWDALCAEAKNEGISVHDVVRRVLVYHVDAYPRCMHALELLARPAPSVPPPAKYLDPVLTVDQVKEVLFDLQ